MTARFLATIKQSTPRTAALLRVAGVGWLVYRVSSRGGFDRDPAGDRSPE